MPGILYGAGVGPGDPELVTIKAKKVIETAPYIAVPKTGPNSSNLALTIVSGYLNSTQEILELLFPMTTDTETLHSSWEKAARQIAEKLDTDMDVCFITLGDPMLFSTFIYIYRIIVNCGYRVEIIPGIPSMCAIAAKTGISLAENDETLAVIPASAHIDMEAMIQEYDNIVLMKLSKNYVKIREILQRTGLDKKTITASRCGLPDERIVTGLGLEDGKPDYFTTLIIKKNGV